ncbi:MAG: hypothetical protein ACI9CF_000685 [Candidatus Omnitrophota bacterium]|jgi:hypothetical protein
MFRFITELFHNRGYRYAVILSLLWHLFWLFFIRVDVDIASKSAKRNMKIYFVGSVLSDDAFNMILKTKPELSQSIYKPTEEMRQSLEPSTGAMMRRMPGDLVSVSVGRNTWNALNGISRDDRLYANRDLYARFPINLSESPYPIDGELKGRSLLYLPKEPVRPDNLSDTVLTNGRAEYEMEVNPAGDIINIVNRTSSGSPVVDILWQAYIKKWQFFPLKGAALTNQKGLITLTFSSKNEPASELESALEAAVSD